MKDDTSTPTSDGDSPNAFERGKAGTNGRSLAECAIEDLRQRGGVFVNAVRATRMPMVLTDPNLPGNPIIFANEAFLKLSGYSMDEVLGQQPHFMDGPITDPKDAARFEEALRADQDDIIQTVQYRKNGSRFVATVLLSAYNDENGRTLNHFMSWLDATRRVEAEDEVEELKGAQAARRESEEKYRTLFESMDEGYLNEPHRMIGVINDITERKEGEAALQASERHAQTLLAELQHRVRNTLAVVRSIARRTADRSRDLGEMVAHFEGRLNAFSRVQSAVTRSAEGVVDLELIVEDELLAVAAREGSQLKIEGPAVSLQPHSAETISLAIHELATNAVKYGALAAPNGRISVTWDRVRRDGHEQLELEWVESGLETPPSADHEGFGHEMIRRTLPYELDAETTLDFTPDGLRITLRMPVSPRVVAEEHA